MWASVAPVRAQGQKQKPLRSTPVPLITPKDSPQDSKLTRVQQPAAQDDTGKEISPGQSRALSQRQIPDKCKLVEVEKDGACLYHAVAKGLVWLAGKKPTQHCHRDLRARAVAHIRRHADQYIGEWDGLGPGLEKLATENPDRTAAFNRYLELAEKESAYASVLEIKALSRLYDVCLLVIPRDGKFRHNDIQGVQAVSGHRLMVYTEARGPHLAPWRALPGGFIHTSPRSDHRPSRRWTQSTKCGLLLDQGLECPFRGCSGRCGHLPRTAKLKHRSQSLPRRTDWAGAELQGVTARAAEPVPNRLKLPAPRGLQGLWPPFPEEPRLAPVRKEGALKSLNLLPSLILR